MTYEQELFLRKRLIAAGCMVKHYTRELDEYREFSDKGIYEILSLDGKDNNGSEYVVYRQAHGNDIKIATFDEFFMPVDKAKYPGIRQEYAFDKANLDCGIGLRVMDNDIVFTISLTEFILGESSLDDILRLQLDILKDNGNKEEVFKIGKGDNTDLYIVRCDGFTMNNFMVLKVKNNIVVGLYYSFNPHVQVNHMYFDEGQVPTWDKLGSGCKAEAHKYQSHYTVLGVPQKFNIEYNVQNKYNQLIDLTVDLRVNI